MTTLSDLAHSWDTPEITAKKILLVTALQNLEAAILRQDRTKMWDLEVECDELVTEIFHLEEKNLKPYPATAPAPLTEEDSAFLPPEWKEVLDNEDRLKF